MPDARAAPAVVLGPDPAGLRAPALMRVLLPPSETKRDGGDPQRPLELASLSFPRLTRPRGSALRALRTLSRDLPAMSAALRLGPTQAHELLRNQELRAAPTMPAIERYTGVLYDALHVPTLSVAARAAAGRSVVVHSALFGLVGADDALPAYRVSHDSRLPGVSMRALWRDPITAVMGEWGGLVLDLRSEAYAALGPLPPTADGWFLRVAVAASDGRTRALNHFNKRGKGLFVRALLESGSGSGSGIGSVDELLAWAERRGIRLSRGAPGELLLVVDQSAPGPQAARQQPSR